MSNQQSIAETTFGANIGVVDMSDKAKNKLIKRLKGLGFKLSLNKVNGRIRRVYVFNYREDKVDSIAVTGWILEQNGSIAVCL